MACLGELIERFLEEVVQKENLFSDFIVGHILVDKISFSFFVGYRVHGTFGRLPPLLLYRATEQQPRMGQSQGKSLILIRQYDRYVIYWTNQM